MGGSKIGGVNRYERRKKEKKRGKKRELFIYLFWLFILTQPGNPTNA